MLCVGYLKKFIVKNPFKYNDLFKYWVGSTSSRSQFKCQDDALNIMFNTVSFWANLEIAFNLMLSWILFLNQVNGFGRWMDNTKCTQTSYYSVQSWINIHQLRLLNKHPYAEKREGGGAQWVAFHQLILIVGQQCVLSCSLRLQEVPWLT